MARKSNKTAHVLNLLAGSDNKNENSDSMEESSNSLASKNSVNKHQSSISIVEAPNSENDPMADVIKNQLLSELEDLVDTDTTNLSPDLPISQEIESILEPDPLTEDNINNLNSQIDTLLSEDITTEQDKPEANEKESIKEVETITLPKQELLSEEVTDLNKSTGAINPDIITIQKENRIPDPVEKKEDDFEYLNVMESLVKERILEFMLSFDMCTCERCIIDTTALALTYLPPKYIVTAKNSVSPLLNYYTIKYTTQVVAQLTKACMVVQDNPYH